VTDPQKIVISRTIDKIEHVKLLDILNSVVNEQEVDDYIYVDLGEDILSFDIQIYSFSTSLIEWTASVLGIGYRAATLNQGMFPNYIFDLNYMMYELNVGDVKRFIAITSDTLLDESLEEPEIFVKDYVHAVEYFQDVAKIKNIIDIHEEDDR
jgi:hypothetical protein